MGSGAGKAKQIEVAPKPADGFASLMIAAKTAAKFREIHHSNVTKEAAKNDFKNLPPAAPSPVKKRDMFNLKSLHAASQRARSITDDMLSDYNQVLAHLKKDAANNLEILWSVFVWLSNVNVFDPKYTEYNQKYSDNPIANFKQVSLGKYDLGLILKNICKKLDIPCVLIDGNIKTDGFNPEVSRKEQISRTRDRWNYVYVQDSWHFIHVDYAARVKPRIKSYFFLTDAQDFNHFCHPDEPEWQLLHKQLSWEDICKQPLCRPEFYAMGLILIRPRFPEVTSTKSLKVEISAPNDLSEKIILHHRLKGSKFEVYVPKEDTISNDSLPISPYQSEIDLKEASEPKSKIFAGLKFNFPIPAKKPDVTASETNSVIDKKVEIKVSDDTTNENEDETQEKEDTTKPKSKYIKSYEYSRTAHIKAATDTAITLKTLPKPPKIAEKEPSMSETDTEVYDFPKHLERYVYMYYGYSRFIFEIELPVTGVYTLDILGDFFELVKNVTKMRSICQFKLVRTGPPFIRELVPMVPEVGWGPNPYMTAYGIKAMTHKDGRIKVEKEQVTVEFQLFGNLNFHEIKFFTRLRNQEIPASEMDSSSRHMVLGDTVFVKLNLPKKGRYVLKIYTKKKGEQGFKNICNYLVMFGKEEVPLLFNGIKDMKYSKRMLREKLQKAIMYGTEEELNSALYEFNIHSIPDEGENKKAKKRLEFYAIRKELADARKRRNAKVIEMTLEKAKVSDYAAELRNEILDAETTLNNIKSLHGFVHPVHKLDQTTLAELRTYTHPLPIIYDVMLAVCVLLREPKDELKTWDEIKHVLLKGGHLNIQYRIKTLNLKEIPDETLEEARQLLQAHSEKEARSVSNGVAAFYKWVKYVLDRKVEEENKRKQRTQKFKSALNTIAVVNRIQLATAAAAANTNAKTAAK